MSEAAAPSTALPSGGGTARTDRPSDGHDHPIAHV